MKKNKLFYIIIAIIIMIVTVIIIRNFYREKRINQFEFPSTIVVNNYSNYNRADTLVMIIVNKIFLLDTINVNIYHITKDWGNDEYEIAGYIQKNPYVEHDYNIFIKKSKLSISLKELLSHELVHLNQMESGDLIQLQDQTKIVFKNDTIYLPEVPYMKRTYEIDAYKKDGLIEKKLNKLLYQK